MFDISNDKVTTKKMMINFEDKNTHEDDITKYLKDFLIYPTFDIEVIGNYDITKFNITYDNQKQSLFTTEFTPLKINSDKLKRYIVPYIDMTHEQLEKNIPDYQIKVPYRNCKK